MQNNSDDVTNASNQHNLLAPVKRQTHNNHVNAGPISGPITHQKFEENLATTHAEAIHQISACKNLDPAVTAVAGLGAPGAGHSGAAHGMEPNATNLSLNPSAMEISGLNSGNNLSSNPALAANFNLGNAENLTNPNLSYDASTFFNYNNYSTDYSNYFNYNPYLNWSLTETDTATGTNNPTLTPSTSLNLNASYPTLPSMSYLNYASQASKLNENYMPFSVSASNLESENVTCKTEKIEETEASEKLLGIQDLQDYTNFSSANYSAGVSSGLGSNPIHSNITNKGVSPSVFKSSTEFYNNTPNMSTNANTVVAAVAALQKRPRGSRRLRTAYTNAQLLDLEKEFQFNKYWLGF